MNSSHRLLLTCALQALAVSGCFMSPQMHLHGIDEATEERFQSLEQRVSALEQGGSAIGPPNTSTSETTGRARAIQRTDYSE